jgi:hypothetical protein
MRTAELIGPALDWAVAKCEGVDTHVSGDGQDIWHGGELWQPSTDWAQGGPIIEREKFKLWYDLKCGWVAETRLEKTKGPTPLVAAMRCFVTARLGDSVDIPEELL